MKYVAPETGLLGRDPFNQNFRKFRSKTQWIGSVQPEKFRKNGSTFWGGPLFPVGPVGILVEWIAPLISSCVKHHSALRIIARSTFTWCRLRSQGFYCDCFSLYLFDFKNWYLVLHTLVFCDRKKRGGNFCNGSWVLSRPRVHFSNSIQMAVLNLHFNEGAYCCSEKKATIQANKSELRKRQI